MVEDFDREGEGNSSGMEAVSIRSLALELKKKGEREFRKTYPHPFLVVEYSPPRGVEWVDPKTIETGLSEMDEEIEQAIVQKAIRVVKTDRNAFQSKITIGRARNNDIVVRAAKISKVHAAFMPDKKGNYKLVDMGSANGTLLNGDAIEQNKPVKLKSGDKISLWRYVLAFHYLDSFLLYLSKLS
jgi:hypothetical protein